MKRNLILFVMALVLITISSAFEFSNDPIKQKFKKMTVMYRDFQGGNKNIYKLEEVIKNEFGLITSHNFYDEKGKILAGSYSMIYDNNGNIKEKKNTEYDLQKDKEIIVRINYINSFADNKLKRTIITDKDNVGFNDTIDYIRDAKGLLIEKKSHSAITGLSTFYGADGKVEKEVLYLKGKLMMNKTFEYGSNGIAKSVGVDANGKLIGTFTYEYNDKGKLIKESRIYADENKNYISILNYNTKGQLSGEERTDKGVKNLLVYEYDDKGMISKLSIKNEKAIRNNERTYVYE